MKRFKSIIDIVIPYISITCLLFVSIFALDWMLMNNYHDKIITEKQIALENAIQQFLDQTKQVSNIAQAINGSEVVAQYNYASLVGNSNAGAISIELINELFDLKFMSGVEEIYIYDERQNRILDTGGTYSDVEVFFDLGYKIDGLTPAESKERLVSLPNASGYRDLISVKIGNKKTKVLEYQTRIPIISNVTPTLWLVVGIDMGVITGRLQTLLGEEYELYIYDKKDWLIYSNGFEYEGLLDTKESTLLKEVGKAKDDLYAMSYHSEDGEWKVQIYIPDLLDEHEGFLRLTSVITILPIVLSIVLCVIFTMKKHKEISDVLETMNKQDAVDGEPEEIGFRAIRESANRLMVEHSQYQERIADYNEGRKREVMDRLIRNTYESKDEITNALIDIKFGLWNIPCLVICIRYEGTDYRKYVDEDVSLKDLVREKLAKATKREMVVFDSAARETVSILFLKIGDHKEGMVRGIISALNTNIFYYYNIDVKIGVGSKVENVYDVARSYAQAKEVIRYKIASGNNIYFYFELERLEDEFSCPKDFEELFSNYMVVGKGEDAKDLVRDLYKDNLENSSRLLSVAAIESLKKYLENCALAVADKYGILPDEQLAELRSEENIKKYFGKFYDFIDRITREIAEKRKHAQNHSISRIVDYIDNHYCENALSLKQVATELGFQETYMSKLFKAAYGENLSVVIEKKRIERARELLKESDYKICDISEMVGYNSDISFRRAFKKVTGMTPGEYREM